MSSLLFLDLETRSVNDLKKCGADVYSKDSTTEILCVGAGFDDNPVSVELPTEVSPQVFNHIKLGGRVIAHNAAFEYALWNNVGVPKYGFPPLEVNQLICTMAMSYSMALPGSLDNATAAVGIAEGKDKIGARVMMQLCQPKKIDDNGRIEWRPYNADAFKQLMTYCKKDVELERDLYHRLVALSPEEQKVWELDQVINNRGILVYIRSVKTAINLVEREKTRLDEKMQRITKGGVTTCNAHIQLTDWLRSEGVKIESVGKFAVLKALDSKIPPHCKEALECRQQAGKSSVAKLPAMVLGAAPDNRIRGMFQYCGAGRTHRFAGRKIQVHNLPRPSLPQEAIDHVFTLLSSVKTLGLQYILDQINLFYGSPLQVLSDCLRGFLIAAPGKTLIAADLEQIEARVVAWLAGQENVLSLFRATGKLYEFTASQIYSVSMQEITKEQRQVGKVAALALGFGGGNDAFISMGVNLGVHVSPNDAHNIKMRWRQQNIHIVRYWKALEEAAGNAIRYPGTAFKAGASGREVTYKMAGSFLWCLLPSKRVLCYPYARLENRCTDWGVYSDVVTYMQESVNKKWEREKTWGGKLVENCTQSVARDLLVEAMMRVEKAGYPIVLHCHDEIVSEVPQDFGSVSHLETLVSEAPVWAYGLPIGAKGWKGQRYQK